MHFYGMSFNELMNLPVHTFWFMSDCVDRVRSEEDLRRFRVANFSQGGEHTQEFIESLEKSQGKVYVVDQAAAVMNQELDRAGLDELRGMTLAMTG